MDKNQDGRIDIDELKQNLFPLASKENLKHLLQVFIVICKDLEPCVLIIPLVCI